MSVEIERKFRIVSLDGVDLGAGQRLRQGYLAEDGPVEVRLRITDGAAVLTVKVRGAGLPRTEVEVPISSDEAEELWPATAGRQLEKERYRVGLGGLVAEVDRYQGPLEGVEVVEVEFASESEATSFSPPAWFGEEITGRVEWSNAQLARRSSSGGPRP